MSTATNPSVPLFDESATTPARILVVDDEVIIREVLARKMNQLGYDAHSAPGGEAALELLRQGESYDLLISGLNMPGVGGVALMKKAHESCSDLAVILVTPVLSVETAVHALKEGAYDYVTKPFSLEEVVISVSRALEKRRLLLENRRYERTLEDQVAHRTRQLREALDELRHTYDSTLLALGTALDSRDAGSDCHSLRVALYSKRLARQIGMPAADERTLEQGALLHDIGNIGVPYALLRKPGPLTAAEWELMRRHPEIGYRIISGIKFLQEAAKVVLQHHERYDGTGDPAGLRGEAIALGARVVAVADTLDRITSNRPFQAAATYEAARMEIKRVSGSQLDPELVAAFLEVPLDEWKAMRHDVAGEKCA